MNATGPTWWAPRAWLPGGWADRVLLQADSSGHWSTITPGVATPPPGAQRLAGSVLPGLVDAHSHAFQRAFAGLAERREQQADDFWGWRDRMYQVALRITPAQLQAIAAQLYIELLRGGYTQVCDFHYLQHDEQGRPYADDPLAMSWALAEAAGSAGIGLTVLPVMYERAGFAQPALRPDQRRFATTADSVWQACQRIAAAGRPLVNAGLALHSLRAAAPESIHRLRALAADFSGPLHIHVAEQTAEVDDCLAATGQRPIEWLAAQDLLDGRWQLVHATHTVPAEIDAVARSGAGAVICPSTEANLGDGLADLPGWLAAGVKLTLGSDSHVTRDWREELRLLEYGQRLARRQRNVSAAPTQGQPATAERLWQRMQAGSGAAAGFSHWGLQPGARADLLVIDEADDALRGLPPTHLLDALVFSSPTTAWRDVMVAGRWVLQAGRHAQAEAVAQRFEEVMVQLWGQAAA
ncbi:formimidoylglutamate deiminase [Aquincola sp. J276]|uniref:formimidoylglutamate deiminase n=1 Tax=Aquincola sp. J276 TaxID=2898432 RepID=UPI0021509771|nr:formimidoylglutamate deiminase [Aquincola sp. J276]MCR5868406.1 formimidoylglutamate deiminase [Aquincola sp. J276]